MKDNKIYDNQMDLQYIENLLLAEKKIKIKEKKNL